MKLRLIIPMVPMIVLLGCGSDSGTFTLSTGTYGLSNTSAVAPDNCNIGPSFPDNSTIGITVTGSNATFAFGPVDAAKNPVSAIQGNTLGSGSKTFDYDNNTNPTGQPFDCVETFTETVSGSLLANDQVQGTLVYSSIRKSGAACTPANLGYKVHPCSSTMTFLAKKR